MTCEALKLPDGTIARVCSRSQRVRKCRFCGQPAGLLCDYTSRTRPSTCDVPLCDACAVHADDKDYCPDHPPRPQLRLL